MITELRRGILFTVITMVLFGGVYNAVVWAIGRVVFPAQAEGSLLRRSDGSLLGSHLIAQPFTGDDYFQPRPSAVDYNAASTGGSNYGPTNPDHLASVRARLEVITTREHVPSSLVPSEMITASGAGMDPHIPPGGADIQVARVAAARGITPDQVRALVANHTEGPWLGIFGRHRVNVLELNLALDAAFPR